MRNLISSKVAAVSAVVGAFAAMASSAMAVPQYDLAPTTTGFTEQVQAALTVGLPIAAGLIALSVGIAWVRKLLKSK
jgi:hypothetical protein